MQFAQGLAPQSSNTTSHRARKGGQLAALHIEPATLSTLVYDESSASASTSTLSSTASEDCFFPQNQKPRSLRNMKKLSLTLPSARSSTCSLKLPHPTTLTSQNDGTDPAYRHGRRASVLSLPAHATATGLLHRKDEDGSPSVPYVDGPVQVIPGIWLGSEDNARDWKSLMDKGVQSILNVAKEVISPFDIAASQPLRPFQSTPNPKPSPKEFKSTFYPAQLGSGRPAMHYLKLPWSHGQTDLVKTGLPAAMAFVDAALERGDSVLIHCQCGISRSATLAIALVMRAAATHSSSVPPEVWDLKGMQAAYAFVKQKSKWIGPNMSLIYQLLDYERSLKGGNVSPTPSDQSSNVQRDEDEWGRRRRMLDDESSDEEQTAVMREAQALDKAMEDRIENRRCHSSFGFPKEGCHAPGRRPRPPGRGRAGSSASNLTNGSILSEDLIEEDEEQELLGTQSNAEDPSSSSSNSPEQVKRIVDTSHLPPRSHLNRLTRPPPSAPAHKSSFSLSHPPGPAMHSKSNTSSRLEGMTHWKRRSVPPVLPTVPPSPSAPASGADRPPDQPPRMRKESGKPAPPPLHLRSMTTASASLTPNRPQMLPYTPSQTLFVFPPSPNNVYTPSTMTVTSNVNTPVPFPSLSTPRVATFKRQGRTRSFIGVSGPPSATTASSRVDVRGWVGMSKER